MNFVSSITWNESTPSPALSLGSVGSNRLVLVALHSKSPITGAFLHPVGEVTIGGVSLAQLATTPVGGGNSNTHLDLYVAYEADLGSLSGDQTIAVGGTINNQKFAAFSYSDMPQTPVVPFFDQESTLRDTMTRNEAVEANGGLLQLVWNTPNGAGASTFDPALTTHYNFNPGSPNGWIAGASLQTAAAIPSKDWVTSVATGNQSNLMTVTLVFPAVAAASGGTDTYRSDAGSGGFQTTVAGPLSATPAAGIAVGSRVWVPDDSAGRRTLNADGTFSSTNPGVDVIDYLVLDTTNNVWVSYSTTTGGSGAVGSLSFAGDLFHGTLNVAFTTDVDLVGLSGLEVVFSDGTNTVEIPVNNILPTGGVIDFFLFGLVDEELGQANGIEAEIFNDVFLTQNGVTLAQGTYRSRGPSNGYLREPLSLDAGALPNLTVGQQFMIEDLRGGTMTPQGVYTRAIDDAFTLAYYTHDSGLWTRHTLDYSGAFIDAEISHNLDVIAGAFDWATVGGVNSGSTDWTASGNCVSPNLLNQPGTIQFPNVRLTQDLISVVLMYGSANDNDNISAGFFTGTDYLNGNFGAIVSNGTGEPDRYEFKRRVQGATNNLNFALIPILEPDAMLVLELFKPSSTFTLFHVDPVGTRTEIRSFVDETHTGLEYPGLVYEASNTNGTCLKAFGFNGQSSLQLSIVNGTSGVADVDGTDVLTFTEDHAPATVTYTDVKGQAVVDANPVVVGSRSVSTNVDLSALWKGDITVSTSSGLSRSAFYAAPDGFKFVNLGQVVSGIMNTAQWAANSQLTYPDDVAIDENGHVTGLLPQLPKMYAIAENTGSGYGAAAVEYFFEDIRENLTPIPDLTVNENGAFSLNLADYYNGTVTLPEHPAPEGIGSSGSGLVIDVTGLPASFSRSGAVVSSASVTAAVADYTIDVTVTDPAGNVQADQFVLSVVSGETMLATVGGTGGLTADLTVAVALNGSVTGTGDVAGELSTEAAALVATLSGTGGLTAELTVSNLNVEDGTGLADSNAYHDVEYMRTYLAARGRSAELTSHSDDAIESAIVQAADYMEARFGSRWRGVRIDRVQGRSAAESQGLAWGRVGRTSEGVPFDNSAVPDAIKEASTEYVLRVLSGTTLLPDVSASASSGSSTGRKLKLGPLELQTSGSSSTSSSSAFPTFPAVDRLLAPYLRSSGSVIRH